MKSDSWKEKVDPAFPKFICVFLKQLEKNKLPSSEGYFYINDMQFKELESHNFPIITNLYEDYNHIDAMIEDENIIRERNILLYLKEFAKGIEEGSAAKVNSACIKIANAMNEDSKKYYLKHYENTTSKNELLGNYYEMNKEKRYEYMRDSAAYDLSIAHLKWKEVNFISRIMTVLKSKNGEKRSVPMSKTLYNTLQDIKVRDISGRVFPISDRSLREAFKTALEKAGIKDFRIHDLKAYLCNKACSERCRPLQSQRTVRTQDYCNDHEICTPLS